MTGRKSVPVTVLHVDWTRCDGHGSCAELLPELLIADDWGYPRATSETVRGDAIVSPSSAEHARRAVRACPLMALKLVTRP
jgi:ferredoxin